MNRFGKPVYPNGGRSSIGMRVDQLMECRAYRTLTDQLYLAIQPIENRWAFRDAPVDDLGVHP